MMLCNLLFLGRDHVVVSWPINGVPPFEYKIHIQVALLVHGVGEKNILAIGFITGSMPNKFYFEKLLIYI